MKKGTVIILAVLAQICLAQPLQTAGKITKVIVYRGQALVTRQIEADVPAGSTEIIIEKLPQNLIPESLYAQAGNDAVVSSVRYREKQVKDEERTGVKEINAKIETLNRELKHTDRDRQHTENLFRRYDPLWTIPLNSKCVDANNAIQRSEVLKSTTGYLEDKFTTIHKNSLELEDKMDDLKKEISSLEKERNKLLEGTNKTEREAVVLVNSGNAGKIAFELKYTVHNAGWLAQYNLRGNPEDSTVLIEYNSLIHQASGENWENVQLSLSTAEPTTEAAPPEIVPIKIDLETIPPPFAARSETEKPNQSQSAGEYKDLSGQFDALQNSRRQVAAKGKAAQQELNTISVSNQMLELSAKREDVSVIQKQAKRFARTEGVSVVYNLGEGFTLPDKSEQQLVTIASFKTKAEFTAYAAPLLTDYVYQRAELANTSDTILLAGPANMYLGGEFVGKGYLNLTTIGEKFVVGFGVDSQIQITREFKDKKIDTLWGNKIEKYEYRLEINNYKNKQVKLRLIERIPYTENTELLIEEFATNTALSTNPEYLRREKDKGILRWDLELAPLAAEKKAMIITYGYTLKYENDNLRTKIVN